MWSGGGKDMASSYQNAIAQKSFDGFGLQQIESGMVSGLRPTIAKNRYWRDWVAPSDPLVADINGDGRSDIVLEDTAYDVRYNNTIYEIPLPAAFYGQIATFGKGIDEYGQNWGSGNIGIAGIVEGSDGYTPSNISLWWRNGTNWTLAATRQHPVPNTRFLAGVTCGDQNDCYVQDERNMIWMLKPDGTWNSLQVGNDAVNQYFDMLNRRPIIAGDYVYFLTMVPYSGPLPAPMPDATLAMCPRVSLTGCIYLPISSLLSIPPSFNLYYTDVDMISQPIYADGIIWMTARAETRVYQSSQTAGPYDYMIGFSEDGEKLFAGPILRPSGKFPITDIHNTTFFRHALSAPAKADCGSAGQVVAMSGWCDTASCNNLTINYGCYVSMLGTSFNTFNLVDQAIDFGGPEEVVPRSLTTYDVDGDGIDEAISSAAVMSFKTGKRQVQADVFKTGKIVGNGTMDVIGYGSGGFILADVDSDGRPDGMYWGYGTNVVGDPLYLFRAIDSRVKGPVPFEYCGDGKLGKGETCETCPTDCAVALCNGHVANGVCEEGAPNYEDKYNCPADCRCGNGVCDLNENNGVCALNGTVQCLEDCPVNLQRCGNGVCDPEENECTCPADPCDTCGNKICEIGEATTCLRDCGTCNNGVQNAGEEGLDCGGVCPNICPPPCTGADCITPGPFKINGLTCQYIPYLSAFAEYVQVSVPEGNVPIFHPWYKKISANNSIPYYGQYSYLIPLVLPMTSGPGTYTVGVDVVNLNGTVNISTGAGQPAYDQRYETLTATCTVQVTDTQAKIVKKEGCILDTNRGQDGEFNYNGNLLDQSVSYWQAADQQWAQEFNAVKQPDGSIITDPATYYTKVKQSVSMDGTSYVKFTSQADGKAGAAIQHELSCDKSWIQFETNVRMLESFAGSEMKFIVSGMDANGKNVEVGVFSTKYDPWDMDANGVYVDSNTVRQSFVGSVDDWNSFHRVAMRIELLPETGAQYFTIAVDGKVGTQKFQTMNPGIKKITGVIILQQSGGFYVDYVRVTSSDESLSSASIETVAERTAKRNLIACTPREDNFYPQVTIGINTPVAFPGKNYEIGDIKHYEAIERYCNMLYQSGLSKTSWCDDYWLQESIRYNSECFWEAMNYCVDVTYKKSNGFSNDQNVRLRKDTGSVEGMTACMLMFSTDIAVNRVATPMMQAFTFGLSGTTTIGVIVVVVIIITGLLINKKNKGG
jgi:hypothetical protein